MDPDDIRKYGMGCGILILGVLCFVYTMPLWWRPQLVPKPQQQESIQSGQVPGEASTAKPATKPEPVEVKKTPEQILESLSYKKDSPEAYDTALKYFNEGTDEEKRAAIKFLPNHYMRLFEEAAGKNSLGEASRIYGLEKDVYEQAAKLGEKDIPHNLNNGLRYMKDKIREMSFSHFKELAASVELEKMGAEIEKAWNDPEASLPDKEALEFLVARWNAAMDKGDAAAAAAAFDKAAEFAAQDVHSISYWNYRSGALEEALCKRHKYKELLELASKSMKSDKPLAALAYVSAAIKKSSAADSKEDVRMGSQDWLERQKLFTEALVGTAALAEAGKLRWLPPDESENTVEIMLQLAANYIRDVDRMDRRGKGTKDDSPPEQKYAPAIKAWDELFKLYLGKLHRLQSRNEPHKIISYCDGMLYETAGRYVSFVDECFGPEKVLEKVPDGVKKELEKKAKTPKEKVAALNELIRTEKYSPDFPGKKEFAGAGTKARYKLGMEELVKGNYSNSFMYFREILRQDPQRAEASDIRDRIASRIEDARKSKDFGTIYYLASFLIGEMAKMAFPEELKTKLAGCLQEAADFFKDSSPMKKAFMLSLLSEVLSGTDNGVKARDEAMKIGFEAVKKLPMKEQEKPALVLPSLVKGCSVEAIKNSTEYHLLAFYDGPEKFFVRLNPYSRGSIALRDGEYEIAVIVTSDNVTPCRSKMKYEKEFMMQKYYIKTSGGSNRGEYPDEFMGDFIIVRIPDDVEKCSVEKESGIIFPTGTR